LSHFAHETIMRSVAMVMLPPSKVPGTMAESFDPYRKWLGIGPKDSANGGPNHYRLLGIPTFESDADVIENAAARQMAHVRTFQGSKHAAISQRILTELSAAKLCLLTPERKDAYDGQLRAKLLAEGKLSSDSMATMKLPPMAPPRRGEDRWRTEEAAPRAVAELPPVPIPMPPAPLPLPVVRRNVPALARARRKQNTVPLLITILSLLVLLGGGGVAAVVVINRMNGEAGAVNSQPPSGAPSSGTPAPAVTGTE